MIVINSPAQSDRRICCESRGKIFKNYTKDNTCRNCALKFKHPQHLGYCYHQGIIVDLNWWCKGHVIKGTLGKR